MAITRSQLLSADRESTKPSKIKFLDNETSFNDAEYHTAEEDTDEKEKNSEELDESSDSDEAPEEQSMSKAKRDILEKQKNVQKEEEENKRAQRERRRQQHLINEQQQLAKKKKRIVTEDLPELLPDNISLPLYVEKGERTGPELENKRHMRFNFNEKEEIDPKKLHRHYKDETLKKIHKRKNKPAKKGPVNVKVLDYNNGKVVPRSEKRVTSLKDKWLNRKSLGKKKIA